jgi:hypothetical protein
MHSDKAEWRVAACSHWRSRAIRLNPLRRVRWSKLKYIPSPTLSTASLASLGPSVKVLRPNRTSPAPAPSKERELTFPQIHRDMVSPKPGMSFPNRRYDFTYDAESLGSGSPANTAQPTRLIKRLITRKGRWLAGVLLAAGVVVYLTGPGSGAGRTFGTGWEGKVEVKDMEDIWDEKNGVVGDDAGYGGGLRPPTPVPRPVDDKVTGTPTTPKTLNTWYQGYIPPFDPDISLLPAPSSLFPEVNLPRFLKPPLSNPFPDIRLREIVSPDPPEEDVVSNHYVLAKDSFSQSWVGQKVWDEPRGEVRSVQLEGKAFPKESKSEKKIREERRDAVRRGFAWAWQGYKDHAWGMFRTSFEVERLTRNRP